MTKLDFPVDKFDAVLFDMDGVLTDTAKVHATCWKKMFDRFLQLWAGQNNEPFVPFDIESDYNIYVDGKPRYEGVQSFLHSRNIQLAYGSPQAPPNWQSVCGLGNYKNEMVNSVLDSDGVETYSGSIEWVRYLRSQGIKTAVVSSSRNCEAVINAAGIAQLFDTRIDGVVAAQMKLAGKPKPDTYLKAAELLSATPQRAVVVEDAISGVQAGRDGGFGLTIGVARKGDAQALKDNGADIVVTDLSVMLP